MDPNDSLAPAQASRAPVVDAAQAAGISPPPGYMPRARSLPAYIPPAAVEENPAPQPDVLDMLRAQPASAAETAVQALEPIPAPVPAPEAPAAAGAPVPAISAAPVARIVSDKPRSVRVPLGWPVEFAGKLYLSITVARPSTVLVADYYDAIQALTDEAKVPRFPVFFDDEGARVPEAVLDALDDDDGTLVFGTVADFLPARLRLLAGQAPEPSPPASGDAIGPK